jgi:DNA polymerase-3 subunit epsilon
MERRPDRLSEATFIAFDTETTGLYPVIGRLVEIGAVRFGLDGEETGVFEQLIDPETNIPPDAQRVNHITDEMVRGQPTVESVLPRFIDFLGSPDNVLMAHNAPFDLEFVYVDMIRRGVALPMQITFDTKMLAEHLMPNLMSYSLKSLGVRLGVARDQRHRALADARLTKEVFLVLLRSAPAIKTIADLAALVPALTFESMGILRVKPPPGFEELGRAIHAGLSVEIIYEGGTRGYEPRKITPRDLLQSRGITYLTAYCHADAREKVYRLDRIRTLKRVP